MRLICTCKICGADDDWQETEDKNHYLCYYCKTESHKGSMRLEPEVNGFRLHPNIDHDEED